MSSIDSEKALERLEGNKDLYLTVIKVFLQDTPLQITKLEEALKTGDLVLATRQAHSIKSASRSIGADALGEICQSLEYKLKGNGTLEQHLLSMERIRTEFDQAEQDLNYYLKNSVTDEGQI